jgi:tRNA(fMet)-specific endonuclease VapC
VIVADTDVLIDYLHGVNPLFDQVSRCIATDRLSITSITVFELLSGANDSRLGRATRVLAESLPLLPLDYASAQCAAEIRRHLEEKGYAIGMADNLIAAIAVTSQRPLLTRNTAYFERVPGLRLVELQKA